MNNPFESGHIRNYVLLYVSVVVIMVLFFIASTLFHDVQDVESKVFDTEIIKNEDVKIVENGVKQESESKFKLLNKAY